MDELSRRFRISRWAAVVYVLLSLILVPWTVYLSYTLPRRYILMHWDASWVGLDIAIACALACTGMLAYKKSVWVVVSATMTASFLLVDAWFDLLSSHGLQFDESILLAAFVEIPLALLCLLTAATGLKSAR